jgi:hypothetical protein
VSAETPMQPPRADGGPPAPSHRNLGTCSSELGSMRQTQTLEVADPHVVVSPQGALALNTPVDDAGPTVAALSGVELAAVRRSPDAVLRLREWGTDRSHVLPDPPFSGLIGTSQECAVRLSDRLIAPKHATLTYDGEQWSIRDRGTPHGVRQDGVRRKRFVLTPGVEVRMGATTLVAESARSAQLRNFCQRLLGWGSDRLRDVDHALRALRLAQACGSSLVLCGEGDLVPVAHALHRHMRDVDAPFIVCDPRRRCTRASVRSPANLQNGVDAFAVAVGGSLCLRYQRLPRDVDKLMRRVHQPDSDVQLFICMPSEHRNLVLTGALLIEMPPLQIRGMELPRIVEEYAQDAMATLDAPEASFTENDRKWVMAASAESLHDIAKATLRVVALRTSENISQAATRLGMASVSLSRWLGRRPPLAISRERAPRRPCTHVLEVNTGSIS